MKNVCMIPVRSGSQRLKRKNYLKINKTHIFEIAIIKAIKSQKFDDIYINSEDKKLEKFAKKYKVKFYLRDKKLASSKTTSDEVVLDFMNKTNYEKLFWINTASPLSTKEDMIKFVNIFSNQKKFKSAISVNSKKIHTLIDGRPLNFRWNQPFSQTQKLKQVSLFNYSIMAWDYDFMPKLKKRVLFDKNSKLIETSFLSSILLKNKNDFIIIKSLMDKLL